MSILNGQSILKYILFLEKKRVTLKFSLMIHSLEFIKQSWNQKMENFRNHHLILLFYFICHFFSYYHHFGHFSNIMIILLPLSSSSWWIQLAINSSCRNCYYYQPLPLTWIGFRPEYNNQPTNQQPKENNNETFFFLDDYDDDLANNFLLFIQPFIHLFS